MRWLVFAALFGWLAALSTRGLGQEPSRRAPLPQGARASLLTKGAAQPPPSAADALGAWISAEPPLPAAWPPGAPSASSVGRNAAPETPARATLGDEVHGPEIRGGDVRGGEAAPTSEAWSEPSRTSFPEPLDMRALALRLCFGTALVLTAFLCLAWAAKWLQRGQRGAGKRVRVIETLVVAPRCWVQLVEVDQRKLLLACDSRGIRTVVPLEAAFETTLDAVEDDSDPTDDEEGLLAVYRSRLETRHAA